MPHATGTQPQKPDNYRASRTASLTPCLTCLTCLGTENALRPGNTPDPGEITAITEALSAGIPLQDVQDAAGHTDPRTTRRYDHGRHNLDRHPTYVLAGHLRRHAESEQTSHGDSPLQDDDAETRRTPGHST